MRYLLSLVALFIVLNAQAQNLSFKMEELSAPEFITAVEKSSKTIILPIGVFEKHGPHMPLGTDLYTQEK